MDPKDQVLADLLQRCAERDQNALKSLYERVGPFLNGLAFRIVRSDDLANDVLQEGFVQIWQNAAAYRPEVAKPLTWMSSIVRYRALDRLEKEQRYDVQLKSAADDYIDAHAESTHESPERATETLDQQQHLLACMETLSDTMRNSIRLAYLEGCSREEIAQAMKTNVNTVKSWLRRGAERLKKCLETKLATS